MFISLSDIYQDRKFIFCPILGILYSHKLPRFSNKRLSTSKLLDNKISKALECVNNPYQLRKFNCTTWPSIIKRNNLLRIYAKILVWSHMNFYLLEWILSHLRMNMFKNAFEATMFFCEAIEANQMKLCLPRSIFVATTSKQFKETGVMFIGIFHPTRHMHAWIIEDGIQPYINDNLWINYTPVSVMV